MLSVNPCLPTRGRDKGGKGRETYKWNIKTTLLITLIILIIIREINYTKLILSFLELGAAGTGFAAAAARQHQAVLDCTQQ